MINDEEDNEEIHNPFDSLFKAFMVDANNARDFLEMHLSPEIIKRLDLSQMFLCPQSFVDNKLKHKHIDVLYRTVLDRKQTAYIYLLTEAQKTPEKLMTLRVEHYLMRIIDYHTKQFKTTVYPVVLPLIFYVGKRPYPYSTDFYDGFGEYKELAKSILTAPFPIINITGTTLEELSKHPFAGTLSKVYQLAYVRDLEKHLELLESQFYYIDTHGGSDLIISMLEFILDQAQNGDADKIIHQMSKMVSRKTGDEVMTLSQKLIKHGVEQGIKQEKNVVAKNLLQAQASFELITMATGLKREQIEKLQEETEPTTH